MEEKDWSILTTLYEKKNMTKAAETLYISQPALSYRIKQLEEEFGIRIVFRRKTGVEFTSKGERLVQYAEQMLRELQKTKEWFQSIEAPVSGILRIGVSGGFARYSLGNILAQFAAVYPGVGLVVETGLSPSILHRVQREDVHLGIIRGERHWSEPSILLNREPICLISKNPLKLGDLPFVPRIHYKINDVGLKHAIDKWWQSRFSQAPLITMEVDNMDTCIELVGSGLGYGLIPSISLKNKSDLCVQELRTVENKAISRETWLVYRNYSMELSVVRAFIEHIQQLIISAPTG